MKIVAALVVLVLIEAVDIYTKESDKKKDRTERNGH